LADEVREVAIRGESIRLGQLLKLADVADSGGEAKELLAEGAVSVNGEVDTRRGRQLVPGDVVAAAGTTVVIAAATPGHPPGMPG
jgi:ribosome-associated protein